MKRAVTICFEIAIVVMAGCARDSVHFSEVRKIRLREILDPAFVAASVPRDRDDDFYEVLEAFSASRSVPFNERVRSIEFSSSSEAELSFSDSGMHGGGSATFTKKGGHWVIQQKLHNL